MSKLYWVLESRTIIVCAHVCALEHSSSAMSHVHIIEKIIGAIFLELVVNSYFVNVVTKFVSVLCTSFQFQRTILFFSRIYSSAKKPVWSSKSTREAEVGHVTFS